MNPVDLSGQLFRPSAESIVSNLSGVQLFTGIHATRSGISNRPLRLRSRRPQRKRSPSLEGVGALVRERFRNRHGRWVITLYLRTSHIWRKPPLPGDFREPFNQL